MNYETFEYKNESHLEVESTAAVEKAVSQSTPLKQLPLAMSYVPMQTWTGTYDACKALQRGTIFPELDLPFCGRGVK